MFNQYEKEAAYRITYQYQMCGHDKIGTCETCGSLVTLAEGDLLEDACIPIKVEKIHDDWKEYTLLVARGKN
jgi:hypothetical protein